MSGATAMAARVAGVARAAVALGGVALAVLLAGPAAADDPLAPAHRARADRLTARMTEYSALVDHALPALEPNQWRELFGDGVVRIVRSVAMEDVDGESREHRRIWAFRLVDAPRVATWLSAIHPDFAPSDRVTETLLESNGRGETLWYQYIDLPWPVRNRHWVIRVKTGFPIAFQTEGRVWELSWRLEPQGEAIALDAVGRELAEHVSLDDARGARYLVANEGAWTMFDLGAEGTLVAYQLTLVLGGWIPESLAARFARRELKTLLDTVARNAPDVVEVYDPEKIRILGGDGHAIGLAEARAAASTRGSQTGSLHLDQFDPDIFMLGRPPGRR